MSPAAPRQGNLIQTIHHHIITYTVTKAHFFYFRCYLSFFSPIFSFYLLSDFTVRRLGDRGGLVGGDRTKKQRNSRLRGAEAPGFALSLLLSFPCCHSFFFLLNPFSSSFFFNIVFLCWLFPAADDQEQGSRSGVPAGGTVSQAGVSNHKMRRLRLDY